MDKETTWMIVETEERKQRLTNKEGEIKKKIFGFSFLVNFQFFLYMHVPCFSFFFFYFISPATDFSNLVNRN